MAKSKMVITNFYSNGKLAFVAEWYEALSQELLEKRIQWAESNGYEKIDTATDTTGRMLKFE